MFIFHGSTYSYHCFELNCSSFSVRIQSNQTNHETRLRQVFKDLILPHYAAIAKSAATSTMRWATAKWWRWLRALPRVLTIFLDAENLRKLARQWASISHRSWWRKTKFFFPCLDLRLHSLPLICFLIEWLEGNRSRDNVEIGNFR